MLITVADLSQPKGKGPWGVKDTNNQWWKLWDREKAKLGIQAGGTYEVEYKSEEYNGKEQRTITGAVVKAGPSAAVLPPKTNYQNSKNPVESKQIGVLSIAKGPLSLLRPDSEQLEEQMVYVLDCAARAYSRTLAGQPQRDDLADNIPY